MPSPLIVFRASWEMRDAIMRHILANGMTMTEFMRMAVDNFLKTAKVDV